MMAAILNAAILDSATFDTKLWLKLIQSDSNSFILNSHNLMMAAILNSAILNFTIWIQPILHKTLTQTCEDWFLSFAQKTHSFIWLNLMMAAILNSGHLGFNYLCTFTHSLLNLMTQPSWILPCCIQPFCTSDSNSFITHSSWWWQPSWTCHLGFNHFAQNKLHSFILTQLDDGSHLEFCHVGFSHCHLEFRHLAIFSQIHLKTLSLNSDSGKLWTQTHSFSPNLMMAAILNSDNLNSTILDSAILVFLSNSLTLAKIGSHHLKAAKKNFFILTHFIPHLEF